MGGCVHASACGLVHVCELVQACVRVCACPLHLPDHHSSLCPITHIQEEYMLLQLPDVEYDYLHANRQNIKFLVCSPFSLGACRSLFLPVCPSPVHSDGATQRLKPHCLPLHPPPISRFSSFKGLDGEEPIIQVGTSFFVGSRPVHPGSLLLMARKDSSGGGEASLETVTASPTLVACTRVVLRPTSSAGASGDGKTQTARQRKKVRKEGEDSAAAAVEGEGNEDEGEEGAAEDGKRDEEGSLEEAGPVAKRAASGKDS